jgi:ABC-type transport system involved in cytochrome bd biosynthesis fused ATPase/permease subunit
MSVLLVMVVPVFLALLSVFTTLVLVVTVLLVLLVMPVLSVPLFMAAAGPELQERAPMPDPVADDESECAD